MGAKLDFIGRNLSNIGIASFGVAGAGVGAGYAAISNDPTSMAGGAAIGAATSAAVIPAAGVVSAISYKALSNIDKVGSAAFGVGRGLIGFGKGAVDMLNSSSPWKNPLGQIANMTQKAASKLVKYEPKTRVWNAAKGAMEEKGGLKLSGWGKMASGVIAAADGAWKAKEAFETSRMGQVDPYITTATPRIPSYKDDAGASGDLVFALNANRRG